MPAVVTKRMWNKVRNKKVEGLWFETGTFPGCCGATIIEGVEYEPFEKPSRSDYGSDNPWWQPDYPNYEAHVRAYDRAQSVEQAMEYAWRGALHSTDMLRRADNKLGGILVVTDAVGIELGRGHGDALDIGARHFVAFLKYVKGLHVKESQVAWNPNTGAPVCLWTITRNDTVDLHR